MMKKQNILRFVLASLVLAGGALFISPALSPTQAYAQKEAKEDLYICPMHPHIHGEEGDSCPICGMFLVPAEEVQESAISNDDHAMHQEQEEKTATEQTASEGTYICPMHPHIHGEEGDSCPICGMFLVPAEGEGGEEDGASSSGEGFGIKDAFIQTIGVETIQVLERAFGDEIRAYGKVTPSTRHEVTFSSRVEGWIERLQTDAVGDTVEKGDVLFTLYSPDLISAQKDYLQARAAGNTGRINASKNRLALLGMDDAAVTKMQQKGQALENVPFHAPMGGTVTALSVRKGSYIKPGSTVLTLHDLSTVWVNADVPEQQLARLDKKDPAVVTLSETGQSFHGMIDFIHPVLNPKTRTGMVRVILDNSKGVLRPDSFVDVTFKADSKKRLSVPVQAVIRVEDGARVIKWLGDGRFKPVQVHTGIETENWIEITHGLSNGDKIVANGHFMLDSEANLKAGFDSIESNDTAPDKQEGSVNHAQH